MNIDREKHPFRVHIPDQDVGLMKRNRVHIRDRYVHLSHESAARVFLAWYRDAVVQVRIGTTDTYTSWEVAA